jgi:uncharacterized membrane protein YphA (DoxX/SURF4 family)
MEIAAYSLQGLLALIFLMAGGTKLAGLKMHVDHFNRWRLPPWFRIVTGIVEVAGAVLLIIGYWVPALAIAGGLVLGCTGIGGVITHARVKDPVKETMPIAVLGIFSFAVFVLYIL